MGELIPSVSIKALAVQRDEIVKLIGQARELLLEAGRISEAAGIGTIQTLLDAERHMYGRSVFREMLHRKDGLEVAIKEVDLRAWDLLIQESGVKTFLDAQARADWDKALLEHTFPELTPENIKATFAQLYQERGEMFERGVVRVFRQLSWDYKSNLPVKLGKRIILEPFIRFFGGVPDPDATNRIDDLVRVFAVLDGKPEPDHRSGTYALVVESVRAEKTTLETEYLSLRWFKKGSVHVHFLRPDLVEKANRIIAKHHPGALPPRSET